MKRKMILFLTLVFLTSVSLFAQMGRGPGHGNRGNSLLTDEQKQELHTLISSMREADATREEIEQAVDALFVEWGIERPGDGFMGPKGNHPELTDEQRAELRELVQSLKDAGATREEIQAAVDALFEEWGLEPPVHDGRWGDMLTAEQRDELHTLVQDMQEAGATREEIQAAVDALFEEWGIERDFRGHRGHGRTDNRRWMSQLSEEQRTTIREMIQEMKENGATREEIRKAVREQLEEWGIGSDDGKKGTQLMQDNNKIQASNAPNPFNPTTTINYTLEEPGQVSVKVYNTNGQLIRTLVETSASEGTHAVVWDGLNDNGEQVSSGLYFYQIASANETVTERMMLMK